MKIRKRSLRGYSESAVREMLERKKFDHRLRMRGLEEELRMLQDDNAKLRRELASFERLEPVTGEPSGEELFMRMAADKLLQAHIEQSRGVWEAMEQLRKLSEEQERERGELLRRRTVMLEGVERRMKEMLEGFTGNEVSE